MRGEDLEFWLQGVGFRVWGIGFSVKKCRTGEEQGFGFRILDFGFGGLGFRVQGVGQVMVDYLQCVVNG